MAVITLDWVPVGHAGNAADPATGSLYGAVSYDYRIGKYEVTNAQYTAFLNAADPDGVNPNGIYNPNMGSNAHGGISFNGGAASGSKYTIRSSMGDKPVNYVSWYDVARFSNWLHNGQGSGSTETGAYTLTGNTGLPTRNPGATVWLPSEDEWDKAAYYDPTPGAGGGDNYWTYATRSDSAPTVATANATGDVSNPGANVVNYRDGADWNSLDGNVTTVGSAGADNFFGTADMNGNVKEWNEALLGSSRGLRGSSWSAFSYGLASSDRSFNSPAIVASNVGFRVASVREPSGVLMTCFTVGLSLTLRRRHSL